MLRVWPIGAPRLSFTGVHPVDAAPANLLFASMPMLSQSAHPCVRFGVPLAAIMTMVAACSSTATDEDPNRFGGSDLEDAEEQDGTSGGGAGQDDGDGTDEDEDDGADDSGSSGEPEPAGDGGDGAPPLSAGCPDEWPRGWVFCEDFEALDDPLDSFSQYASAEGAFAIDPGVGAMRADYRQGVQEAGWVLVSFGDSPLAHEGGTTHAAGEHFEEVFWRVKVKHEKGWPGIGPGMLGRASAFAGEDWSEALVAQLQSAGTATTLEAVPLSCVSGESVDCAGFNDHASLRELDTIAGKTELFSGELAGEWHCVEAHVRLNVPGAADGVFEFWVDGELENGRTDVDWRGYWGEYGLNAVTLENFWPGGATADLTRWMDDIVVSTERIGCD